MVFELKMLGRAVCGCISAQRHIESGGTFIAALVGLVDVLEAGTERHNLLLPCPALSYFL